jgi:thiosulfate/3-mercaptopyruvate sulfurtransferase
MDALISTDWLAAHIAAVRVVDLRWTLGGGSARAAYDRGHLPGAVFIDLDRELAGDPARGPGRHPLPAPAQLEAAMARAGIGADTDVVVYDDCGGSIAARLWYLLRLHGHRAGVAVLDGGLPRWVAEGRPLETVTPSVRVSGPPFRADPSRIPDRVVDRAAVDAARRDPATLLLDARARERFRGDVEPIDARPGHIPGARSAPWAENLEDGVFRAPAALRARYAALGAERAERTIVYCGSGVTACHDLLALHLAGFSDDRLRLYVGSWSDWSRAAELPAATGDD